MSTWALGLAGLLYVGTAVDLYFKGQHGMSLAFAAYAVANVGFIWAAVAVR